MEKASCPYCETSLTFEADVDFLSCPTCNETVRTGNLETHTTKSDGQADDTDDGSGQVWSQVQTPTENPERRKRERREASAHSGTDTENPTELFGEDETFINQISTNVVSKILSLSPEHEHFVLSDERVYHRGAGGNNLLAWIGLHSEKEVTVIPLEEVSSVSVTSEHRPSLLMASAAAIVLSVIPPLEGDTSWTLAAIAGILITGYLITRKRVLKVHAEMTAPAMSLKGVKWSDARDFIREVSLARAQEID